ncbi:DUF6058 family natural product biosynthesis protein (plasmid) [Pseudoalteromonas sp. T1lg65]|uniref:DUF6058 family natural product biosynthesis protein n=1 Tax=Pseudoalteromonas sp. T1lg65 TaxID=2077101 RepID=UPI003F7A5277
MELINYLNEHYLTKSELLNITKVTEETFVELQTALLMPQASYKLKVNLSSDSFFGQHDETHDMEYYAKGYATWLGIVQTIKHADEAYRIFESRYISRINQLKEQGYESPNEKVNQGLTNHIKEEWGHFLNGIYGLCTKSGLPEDIASKEFAIIQINELLEKERLDDSELARLEKAVNLLDSASSYFAPHERENCSRHRLIDEVRRKYQLKSNIPR